jgi:hypothetical protein
MIDSQDAHHLPAKRINRRLFGGVAATKQE